jgi:hypothetical protein
LTIVVSSAGPRYGPPVVVVPSDLMAGPRGRDDHQRAYGRGAYSDASGVVPTGYRRRQPAVPTSHTYQCEAFELVLSVIGGMVGVVAGIVALALGEIQGLLLLGGGCLAVFTGIWTPHRVTLDDSGVLLRAVVRRIRIPWEELRSVAPPWWDISHHALKWGRHRRLDVVTLQAFPELHRMLIEVEQRSPKTYVSS